MQSNTLHGAGYTRTRAKVPVCQRSRLYFESRDGPERTGIPARPRDVLALKASKAGRSRHWMQGEVAWPANHSLQPCMNTGLCSNRLLDARGRSGVDFSRIFVHTMRRRGMNCDSYVVHIDILVVLDMSDKGVRTALKDEVPESWQF